MFNPLPATTIGALEQTLAFTERRHELLAGNIANLSTPDYRSRDLDVGEFRTALADSIRSKPSPSPPRTLIGTDPHAGMSLGYADNSPAQRLAPVGPTEATTRDDRFAGPRAATEQIVYHDNSDVSLENQVTEISKNKHLHNLAISTLRNQFDLLRAAITERA